MRTLSHVILLSVVLTGVFPASLKADTVYSYVGDTFTFDQGVYTQADRITGSFVLSGSFVSGPGAGRYDVTNFVTNYSFTDGHQTLTQSNSTGDFQVGFGFNGTPILPGTSNPTGFWYVDITTPTSGIFTEFVVDYEMFAWIGGAGPSGYQPCNGGTALCYTNPTISTATILGLDNRAPGFKGTWTMQVPEGGTTALFLLAGLTILTPFICLKRVTRGL